MHLLRLTLINIGVLVALWSSVSGNKQEPGGGGWFGRRLALGQKQAGQESESEYNYTRDNILDTNRGDPKEILENIVTWSDSTNTYLDAPLSNPPPPPPPPLPIPSHTNQSVAWMMENPTPDDEQGNNGQDSGMRSTFNVETLPIDPQQNIEQQQQQVPGFPYQPNWGQVNSAQPQPIIYPSYNPYDMAYGHAPPIMPPPPNPLYTDWTQQQQQYNNQIATWRQYDHEKIQSLQSQLDGALQYQSQLYSEVQNLTESMMHLERITDLQLNQIQVLTERVADANQNVYIESNRVLEYQINCTILQQTITNLTFQLDHVQFICNNVTQNLQLQLQEKVLLEQKLQQKEMELQDFAMRVEKARMHRQVEEKRKLLQDTRLKKKALKKGGGGGGLFSWIFHWFIPSSSSSWDSSYTDDSDEEEEDEVLLEDLARSTLLHALQTERNNVNELETLISTLQQNNSAIADMVQSRDSLIEELNKRVGVFEDDKMVLKAALRQLQNEIKQEAPKTEQLIADLAIARQDVRDLESELESLKSLHEKEIDSMNTQLKQKQTLMDETDSKMNMIGVYVDQLEERLASFAMARRDIEAREERCKGLEQKLGDHANEIEVFKNQLETLSKERGELKDLVDLLVRERTALDKKKVILEKEIKGYVIEGENMRTQIHAMTGELNDMKQQMSDLTMTLGEMQSLNNQNEMEIQSLRNLRGEYDHLIEQADDLNEKVSSMENELSILREEKDKALIRMSDAEESKAIVEGQLAESLLEVSSYKAELESLNKLMIDTDPQPTISAVWDQMGEIMEESMRARPTQDYLRTLNKSMIQSLALALYNATVQSTDQDIIEAVKSLTTKEFKKLLSNESAIDWLKEGLKAHLHESLSDNHLSWFLMSEAAMRALVMIVLTKMVVQLVCDQGATPFLRADGRLDELPPPPPPPLLEAILEDIDSYIPYKENDFFESAKLGLQVDSIPSHIHVTQPSVSGESKAIFGFSAGDVETSEDKIEQEYVHLSTERGQEVDVALDDESSSFDSIFATNRNEGMDLLNDETNDKEIIEPGASSINILRVFQHNQVSPARRNVPFRHIRKFLSRKTGIHGLITPPSKGSNAPTQP